MSDVMADRRKSPAFFPHSTCDNRRSRKRSKNSRANQRSQQDRCYVDSLNPLTKGTKVQIQLKRGEL